MTKYDTHYFERYALLTLENAFPEWRTHFKNVDRPDLQNEIDGIGIEVTSSTPSHIREVDSFGAKLLGKKVSEKDEERFRGMLFLTPERVAYAYSSTKGMVNADKSPQIIAAMSRKRSAWNKRKYKVFRTRGLYIFAGTGLIDEEMLEKIEKSEAFSFFQLVIINAMNKLYFHSGNEWQEKEFSDEEMAEFHEKAFAVERFGDTACNRASNG